MAHVRAASRVVSRRVFAFKRAEIQIYINYNTHCTGIREFGGQTYCYKVYASIQFIVAVLSPKPVTWNSNVHCASESNNCTRFYVPECKKYVSVRLVISGLSAVREPTELRGYILHSLCSWLLLTAPGCSWQLQVAPTSSVDCQVGAVCAELVVCDCWSFDSTGCHRDKPSVFMNSVKYSKFVSSFNELQCACDKIMILRSVPGRINTSRLQREKLEWNIICILHRMLTE